MQILYTCSHHEKHHNVILTFGLSLLSSLTKTMPVEHVSISESVEQISMSKMVEQIPMSRRSHQRCSQKFHKIYKKTPVPESLFIKFAGLRLATLLKERLWHMCFPVNIAKFLTTSFNRTPLNDCFYLSMSVEQHLPQLFPSSCQSKYILEDVSVLFLVDCQQNKVLIFLRLY